MERIYKDLLAKQGLSVTATRLCVLEALDVHPHADAERIFSFVKDKIATNSKQAIYNNLAALTDCGILREIKPKGYPALYETRVGDNHHHIICRQCAVIMDTNCRAHAPCLEPADLRGFTIDEAEVIFWGICPTCQKTRKSRRKK